MKLILFWAMVIGYIIFARMYPEALEAGIIDLSKVNGMSIEQAMESTPEIDDTAQLLCIGDTEAWQKSEHIYNFICQKLRFDTEHVFDGSRTGVRWAWQNRRGVCLEYAMLYRAMAKAVGLKSEVCIGQVWDGQKWFYHAWNAYYSDGVRHTIDCCWGDSKGYIWGKGFRERTEIDCLLNGRVLVATLK